jgi:hypothetical protein
MAVWEIGSLHLQEQVTDSRLTPHIYMHLPQLHGPNIISFHVIQSILVGGVDPTPLCFHGSIGTAELMLNYCYY